MENNIEAIIFDWAGTVVDFGSQAPTTVFVEAFKQAFNFDISLAEAREPMGLGKWDHIRTLANIPAVDSRWKEKFGESMSDDTVTEIYQTFMPLQKAKVASSAGLIAGAEAVIKRLKNQGIKIGSCSGYPREVLDILADAAKALGYEPDCIVATDDLPQGGRPGAAMALQNMLSLEVKKTSHCIKVDDAAPGILEGLNAGMWTIGILDSGNEVGLSETAFSALNDDEKAQKRAVAAKKLLGAGAHLVINTIADLEQAIDIINTKINQGERP